MIAQDMVDAFVRTGTAIAGDEVSTTTARRGQYSSDASNYRVVPEVVVRPRSVEELADIHVLALDHGLPLTLRGAGTSVAGNAIGAGVVLDTSAHLDGIVEIDPASRTALVEPGVVVATLNRRAKEHGLRFGPDPSTHARATIGGVIGNNACGAHALAYGRAADNVVELEVIDGHGRRFTASDDLQAVEGLEVFTRDALAPLRLEFGRFGRQVSGYSLEHLLPEHGHSLARALVGTEGTVATTLRARVRLVPLESAPVLVVLGYPTMADAADAVPALLAHRPLAIEGIDARLVDVIRRHRGAGAVPPLPEGSGWMLVEVGGGDEALTAAAALASDGGTSAVRILPAGPEAAALWRIREDGAGLAGRTPRGRQAWPGWEDAAVPPERLGAYLRDFELLMREHGVEGLPFGHFGDGCIHVRLDIPLDRDGRALRAFVEDSARLVVSHGGSLSGEHGDGRARSGLLPLMYSAEALELQRRFKALFDPRGLLNPGIIVDAAPVEQDLRRPAALTLLAAGGFAFREDGGDITAAVHRCVGVGKCRADVGGFMCPSFQATRDENDVTRGRARTLQEMANGTLVTDGWRSREVHDALDLCLSCKACASECPAGVDMARYKSEALFRRYRRRLRPVSHYVLGWLPRWSALAGRAPRLVNALASSPVLSRIALRLGGMDVRRGIPAFAARPFRRRPRAERAPVPPGDRGEGRRVVLWVDSFSDGFSPDAARAAVDVLRRAGCTVVIPEETVCCGLTWISTGQLDGARRRLKRLVSVFAPFVADGYEIVGLEPSCTAVLRGDLPDLLPDDEAAAAISSATRTLAEVLETSPGWQPPDLGGLDVVVQPHCHHHAVMGFGADRRVLERANATVQQLAGCCGLAGDFGMERGHYETSVAVAEHALLPALRARPVDAVFLADGFSCRTQAEQLAGVRGITLAELLIRDRTVPDPMRRIGRGAREE